MQIQLTNVSPEQLEALKKNFVNCKVKGVEGTDVSNIKYDVEFTLDTEIDAWKLFFSGADYCLAKMGRVKL